MRAVVHPHGGLNYASQKCNEQTKSIPDPLIRKSCKSFRSQIFKDYEVLSVNHGLPLNIRGTILVPSHHGKKIIDDSSLQFWLLNKARLCLLKAQTDAISETDSTKRR